MTTFETQLIEQVTRIADALEAQGRADQMLSQMLASKKATAAPISPIRQFEDYRETKREDGSWGFEILVDSEWLEATPLEVQAVQNIQKQRRKR